MAKVEILDKTEYDQWKDQEIRNAQASRGDLKIPLTLSLPRKKVLVLRGIGEREIDAEIDTFR